MPDNKTFSKPKNAALGLLAKIMANEQKDPESAIPPQIKIEDVDEHVVITFDRPVISFNLQPAFALHLAQIIAHHAALAHDKEEAANNPAGLILPDDAAGRIVHG